MIPENIHFIWLQGFDNLPEEFETNLDLWYFHHPQCLIEYWDDERIVELLHLVADPIWKFLYKKCTRIIEKCDVARLAIIETLGGIYCDVDTVCRKNVMEILKECDFFVVRGSIRATFPLSYMIPDLLQASNFSFGSVARHPVFKTIRQQLHAHLSFVIFQSSLLPRTWRVFLRTGPFMLTCALWKYPHSDDLIILPWNIWGSKNAEYVSHTFANTWIH